MWAQMVNVLLGVWLMAAPTVLGYAGAAAVNDRVIGPVASSFALVAIWEILRPLRWANLGIGAWLLAAPWIFDYAGGVTVNSIVTGVLLMVFAAIRGEVEQGFGGGWSSLWASAQGSQLNGESQSA